jgi:tRNA (guanine37-N1)-methyltransferase
MQFHIITIFKDMFDSYLQESILGRAVTNKHIAISFYNPRDFINQRKQKNKKDTGYRPVDDRPYGGGPGMVMRAEPILEAVENALKNIKKKNKNKSQSKVLIINFVPTATKFTTDFAKKSAKKYTDIILICGRYEGIDSRVDKILKTTKISVGDYVLTGGELPAMIVVDSISRQIKGVLGKFESLEEERVSSSEIYTRPEILKWNNKNYKVPKVLLSGNHKDIEEWKKKGK